MLDIIGCPINVGDTVLVSGYSTSAMDTIAVVQKVNRKTVLVTLKAYNWDCVNGKYHRTECNKPMRRAQNQLVVINKQIEYIQEHFPENLL